MYDKITHLSPPEDQERFVVSSRLIAIGGMGAIQLGFDTKEFEQCAIKWNDNIGNLSTEDEIRALNILGSRYPQFFPRLKAVVVTNEPEQDSILKPTKNGSLDVMVMNLIPGETAQRFFFAQEHQVPRLRNQFAQKVLTAVQHIHNEGIVHCDISPTNIMTHAHTKPNQKKMSIANVRVLDFGVSHSEKNSVQGYYCRGKYQYGAPEVCFNVPIEPSRDIFALGMTLCVLFGGNYPAELDKANGNYWVAGDIWDRLQKTYNPKKYIPNNCGQQMSKVIEGCIQFDPKNRYSSAASALRDLQ